MAIMATCKSYDCDNNNIYYIPIDTLTPSHKNWSRDRHNYNINVYVMHYFIQNYITLRLIEMYSNYSLCNIGRVCCFRNTI